MQTLELKVEQDHIESLAKVRNPIIAIEELIWNGLDADAEKIVVELALNKLGGLSKIVVSDNGTGIKFDECEHAFGHLGGSPKSRIHLTPGGRVPHGFLDLLQNHIAKYGSIEVERLYEPPFTLLHTDSLDGLFDESTASEVLNIIGSFKPQGSEE